MATCVSVSSATARQLSMAAGVVPQSSCSLSPMAPAATCSRSGPGREALPLARKPRLMGRPSAASSMRWIFHAPDAQVVALVPVAGPVPPPAGGGGGGRRGGGGRGAAADESGGAGGQRLVHELRADEVDMAVDAARGDDAPPAGDHLGGGAGYHGRRHPRPGVRV